MLTKQEIKERLWRYLKKEITLNQFEAWFVPASWNMHQDSAPDAQQLAAQIELIISEPQYEGEAFLRGMLFQLYRDSGKAECLVTYGTDATTYDLRGGMFRNQAS